MRCRWSFPLVVGLLAGAALPLRAGISIRGSLIAAELPVRSSLPPGGIAGVTLHELPRPFGFRV